MSEHSEFVVQKKKTATWYVLALVALIFSLTVAFILGKQAGKVHSVEVQLEAASLRQNLQQREMRIKQQLNQITQYKTQIGMLEAERNSTGTSEAKANETINQLQDKIRSLEKELTFFRNIMSPEEVRQGLQIEKFVAEKAIDSNDIKFRLSLIQAKKHNTYISGSVNIALVGNQDGKSKTINLSSITESPKNWNFKFKYLQHIKGTFVIPEGFEIKAVKVSAKIKGNKALQVDREFQWQLTETKLNVEQQKKQKPAEG